MLGHNQQDSGGYEDHEASVSITGADLLNATKELLQRPVNSGCDMKHEDVMRDARGELVFMDGSLLFAYECGETVQHFGCPHFLDRHQFTIRKALMLLIASDKSCEKLLNEFEELFETQLRVNDVEVRFARIGTFSTIDQNIGHLPDVQTAAKNVVPHLQNFRNTCAEIEAWRMKTLVKIEAALAALEPRT